MMLPPNNRAERDFVSWELKDLVPQVYGIIMPDVLNNHNKKSTICSRVDCSYVFTEKSKHNGHHLPAPSPNTDSLII